MDSQRPFIVTAKARAFVAGRRNPGIGETLLLSEDEAAFAVVNGELTRRLQDEDATTPATPKIETAAAVEETTPAEPAAFAVQAAALADEHGTPGTDDGGHSPAAPVGRRGRRR